MWYCFIIIMHSPFFIFCFVSLVLSVADTSVPLMRKDDVVKMRIIVDPASALNLVSGGGHDQDEEDELDRLVPSVAPASFVGPGHFRPLLGQCFTLQKGSFEYKLCPFQNVTQRETAYVFNRKQFHGIIGIWQDWIVENGSFAGWRMKNGDLCGTNKPRDTTVRFACDDGIAIVDMTEPEQCHYSLTLELPQACFPDSLLVYPALSENLRMAWDILEGEKEQMEVTESGYAKRLDQIFTEAGFVRLLDDAATLPKHNQSNQTIHGDPSVSGTDKPHHLVSSTLSREITTGAKAFSDLTMCQQAYNELMNQIGLRNSSTNGLGTL